LAKKARVYDGTAWQELASAQTDLTAYSTTAQMNTAITAGVGLVPILTQTIGTAVSSVVVSNAFSAAYDNYKITVSGGVGSAVGNLGLRLGATTTGYYAGLVATTYSSATIDLASNNNSSSFTFAGRTTTDSLWASLELSAPFLSKNTFVSAAAQNAATGGSAGAMAGYLNNTTSYTDFTLTPASGTITGGTIRVYGYKN